ncbi:hypothetical protein JXO59_08475 [candidate division KSB1 bacterium]|nr:hypothetical protein [candidate division KSB1 bacterium]
MRRIYVVAVVLLCCLTGMGFSQYADGGLGYMGDQRGQIMGGVGFASIDEGDESKTYVSIGLRPELAIGKFGIGLNINLLYDTDTGHIRSKDWDSSYDYLRLIRYLRYGRKLDPVYVRVGTMDAARLGHGFIVNYYTNEASYDNRKIGLELDLDFGHFGFETITSNMARAELLGMRGYYRPLYSTEIPIIKNFALGASFARDFDPDERSKSDDAVSVYGFDVELPLVRSSIFNTYLYYDWAQIHGYSSKEEKSRSFGSGQAVGIYSGLGNLLGVLELAARVERRWLGEEFMASYFDPFYEVQRFQISGDSARHKADYLTDITGETKGVFGELYGNLLGNRVRLLGMLARLDDEPNSGRMHLAADAPALIPVIAFHATYDKIGVEKVKDVFTLNNESVARVGVGYKIKPYLIMYVDYIWTFVETEPGSREYKPQERVEPKLQFVYHIK